MKMEQGETSYCIWERDPSEMSPRNFPGGKTWFLRMRGAESFVSMYAKRFCDWHLVAHDSKQTLETPCPSVREQWSSLCPSSLNHGRPDLQQIQE